jgi:hypothetical protein
LTTVVLASIDGGLLLAKTKRTSPPARDLDHLRATVEWELT